MWDYVYVGWLGGWNDSIVGIGKESQVEEANLWFVIYVSVYATIFQGYQAL